MSIAEKLSSPYLGTEGYMIFHIHFDEYDAFLMTLLFGIKDVIKFCMYNRSVICIKATNRLKHVFVLVSNSMHIKFRSNLSY